MRTQGVRARSLSRALGACVLVTLIVPGIGPLAAADHGVDVWEPPKVPGGIEYIGCNGLWGAIPIQRQAAQMLLPDGFVPTRNPVFNNVAVGSLGVFAQDCTRLILPDGTVVEGYQEVWHMIPVIAPPSHDRSGFQVFVTGYISNSEEAAAYFEAWNLADDANGAVVYAQQGGAVTPGGGVAAAAGLDFSVTMEVTGAGLNAVATHPFHMWLYTADENGEATEGAHILIGEGRSSLGVATVAFGHGAPLTSAYGGTNLGVVYEWDREARTQTMAHVVY